MNQTPTLATRFAPNTHVLRSETPLHEDQMRRAAPSIFAGGKHASRSERYTYIPTIEVLRGLMHEGFQPYMVAQGRSRIEGKTEYTKHMVRMRHAGQVTARPEANEIILINSHDGASSYQMLAGVFRFVCCKGSICVRSLRRAGGVTGLVLPFAHAAAAEAVAARHNEEHPHAPWVVVVVDSSNCGDHWVVSEEDVLRLAAQGCRRYTRCPLAEPTSIH